MKQGGFSLLEHSVTMTILSILICGGVIVSEVSIDNHKKNETIKKMLVIEKAIIAYSLKTIARSNFLSTHFLCPASPEIIINHSEFGKELKGNNCLAYDGVIKKQNYYFGVVPIRTLELPDYYMFDGWGRRLSFIVNTNMKNNLTQKLYYIISHGTNGKGAYNRDGFQIPVSGNIAEKNNSNVADNYQNISDFAITPEFDDIVKGKSYITLVRDITGGILLNKALCKILNLNTLPYSNCSLLKSKIQTLCHEKIEHLTY